LGSNRTESKGYGCGTDVALAEEFPAQRRFICWEASMKRLEFLKTMTALTAAGAVSALAI
jgi:hypothetical protein